MVIKDYLITSHQLRWYDAGYDYNWWWNRWRRRRWGICLNIIYFKQDLSDATFFGGILIDLCKDVSDTTISVLDLIDLCKDVSDTTICILFLIDFG